jgi:hypothetical protein
MEMKIATLASIAMRLIAHHASDIADSTNLKKWNNCYSKPINTIIIIEIPIYFFGTALFNYNAI